MYTIKLPMKDLAEASMMMDMLQNRQMQLSFNECLYFLTTQFMFQHHLFPLRFNPTTEYAYKCDGLLLHITIPKDSVDTRELKEGEIGYVGNVNG